MVENHQHGFLGRILARKRRYILERQSELSVISVDPMLRTSLLRQLNKEEYLALMV